MKPTLTLLLLFIGYFIAAQDFDGARPVGSSSYGVNLGFQYNTNIQFTTRTWSGSHAILFNSHASQNMVNGSLGATGNTKYANNVGSNTSGAGAIMFYGNGGTMDFLISPNSTGAGDNIVWGTPKMRIKRDGKVGIGTSSPTKLLDVNGDARIGSLSSRKYLKISSAEWPEIRFETPSSNEQIRVGVAHADNSNYDISEGDFYVYTQTVGKMPLVVQRDSDVILNSNSGKVGIGTTTPIFKLDLLEESISGSEDIQRWKISDSNSDYLKIINATNASGQFIPSIYGYHDTDNRQALHLTGAISASNDAGSQPITVFDSRIANGPANNRPLFAWDSYGNRKMTLTANGNLGIGTTNPTEKLEVAGTIYSREVKVEVAAGTGPDYVFEPTYNLRTLEETEAYIQTNKHLPEIPSAKEMEANGVQLGEMNMLLLKKIEELTLHAIAQEKRISQLEPYPSLLKEREAKQGELEKKIEELTLHLIEKEKEIRGLKESHSSAITELAKRIEKLEKQ
ncbi:hypothetical protein [Ekhidna sp.]|uniref:hypothetical protein n=1 Tax=Ekhidna sp. TaxID=2608089 RepID=UPI003B506DC2